MLFHDGALAFSRSPLRIEKTMRCTINGASGQRGVAVRLSRVAGLRSWRAQLCPHAFLGYLLCVFRDLALPHAPTIRFTAARVAADSC